MGTTHDTQVTKELSHYKENTHLLNDYHHKQQARRAIRNCTIAEELEEFSKAMWGTDWNELRTLSQIHKQKLEKLPIDYTPTHNFFDYDTFKDESIDFEEWAQLYSETTVTELEKYRVYAQTDVGMMKPEEYRIFSIMCYYKTGNRDYIVEAYDLNNRGRGFTVTEQKAEIANVLDSLDPIIGSLICGYVNKITTNKTDSSTEYGTAKNYGQWLNIVKHTYSGSNTVAHEFGHAIQYAYGINCDSSIDEREDNEETDYTLEKTYFEFAHEFQDEIEDMWEQYIDNELTPVRTYQEKNFNEFFACAFEYWVDNNEPYSYTRFFDKHLINLS